MRQLKRLIFAISFLVVLTGPGSGQSPQFLKTIYIVPILGHLDLGFTATQAEVEKKWPEIYRQGIKFLEANPTATITSDSMLPVRWFKESASEDEWERFKGLVKSGRWELTAGFAHMNTAMMDENEGRFFFSMSNRFSYISDEPINIWLHADVPGLGWNMAEAATDADLDMIVVGANELGGFSPLPDLPRLFNWAAPDGETILVSLHGGSGYMEGGLDLGIHVLDGLEGRLDEFQDKLKEENYPLDIAMVLFSSGDNRGPESFPQLLETIAKWNASGKSPRLEIATFSEFYKLIEDKKSSFPTIAGDWPASWEALTRRAPFGEALVRQAKRIFNIASGLGGKPDWLSRAILLHDEHSGPGSWPRHLTREQAVEQNKTEYEYAETADRGARGLLKGGIKRWFPDGGTYTKHVIVGYGGGKSPVAYSLESGELVVGAKIEGFGYSTVNEPAKTFQESFGNRPPEMFWDISEESNETMSLGEIRTKLPFKFVRLNIYDLALNAGFTSDSPKNRVFYTHKFNAPIKLVGFWRAGIFIEKKYVLSKHPFIFSDDGIVISVGHAYRFIQSLDGAPFIIEGDTLKALVYIRDEAIVFKNGERGYVPAEPDVATPFKSKYLVAGPGGTGDTKIYARPTMKQVYLTVNSDTNEQGRNDRICFVRSSDPRAVITGHQWPYVHYVFRVRNVSDDTVETEISSDYPQMVRGLYELDARLNIKSSNRLRCLDSDGKEVNCFESFDIQRHVLKLAPHEVVQLGYTLPYPSDSDIR